MNFSDFYYTEAKLSVGRQFLNLFSKEKAINIDLEKDLIHLIETNERTFSEVNDELADSYKTYKQLKKSLKLLKHDTEDKAFERLSKKQRLKLQTGSQIINVFKVNIKGGQEKISPYNKILASAAYETGRHLIHYGYIISLVTEYIDGSSRYYIGVDKLGAKFFIERFGQPIDVYLAASSKGSSRLYIPKYKDDEEEKEKEEPEKPSKVVPKLYSYIKITESPRDVLADIKNTWGDKEVKPEYKGKIVSVKKDLVRKKQGSMSGYIYELESGNDIGVYMAPPALIIIFYGGDETVKEAANLGLFNNLESIGKPQQLFMRINRTKSLDNI